MASTCTNARGYFSFHFDFVAVNNHYAVAVGSGNPDGDGNAAERLYPDSTNPVTLQVIDPPGASILIGGCKSRGSR